MNLVRLRPTAKQFSLNFSDLDERTYKVASIRFLVTVWELDIIDSCTDLGIIFWWLSKEPLFKVYTCSYIFAVHIVSDIKLCLRLTQNMNRKLEYLFKCIAINKVVQSRRIRWWSFSRTNPTCIKNNINFKLWKFNFQRQMSL